MILNWRWDSALSTCLEIIASHSWTVSSFSVRSVDEGSGSGIE